MAKKIDFKKANAEVVKNHFNLAKEAIKRKKDILEGSTEELGEQMKRPRNEISQLLAIVEKIDDTAEPDLCAELVALEYDTRRLVESIDHENQLAVELKKGAQETKLEDITQEIEKETFLADIMLHQLTLLNSMKMLIRSIIRQAKGKDFEELVGTNLTNLDNIAGFIVRVILNEEYPNLQIAYNMLELEEWPELMQKIDEIKAKFVPPEPKLL